MISIPLIGIVLAPGWNGRKNSLLILLGGIALWLPYLLNVSSWWVYISQKTVDSSDHQTLAATYSHYRPLVEHTLETFVAPVGNSAWISMHSVAIHPIAVLITAVLGLLCVAPRKALFIIGGFAAGFSTAVVSYQGAPSTHRMMCAFLFISIASAAFFNAIATKFKSNLVERNFCNCDSHGEPFALFLPSVLDPKRSGFLSWRNSRIGILAPTSHLLDNS
jgi:hypothetical protein